MTYSNPKKSLQKMKNSKVSKRENS